MGNCNSDITAEVQASREIDKAASKDERAEQSLKKFLLLGAGESGKSTLFKQLNHIYGDGYTDNDRMQFTNVLFNNTIGSMKTLVLQAEKVSQVKFGGEVLDCTIPPELEPECKFFREIGQDAALTPEGAASIKKLWACEGIQNIFKVRSDYQLPDAAEYFFSRVDAFTQPNFVPSYEDMLRGRVRTTGIVETCFEIAPHKFRVVDVGGQRNERRKWIHCFEGVTAVIFVAALSEYNQKLYEDESVDRMTEALNLFAEICNSRWFQDTSVVLFLNKSDLFREKLKHFPISVYFEDYTDDPKDFEKSSQHIKDTFESRNKSELKAIYSHITCATDTTNVDRVFCATKDIVIRSSLRKGGLL